VVFASAAGAQAVPFHFNTWLAVGAVAATGRPCKPTTVSAVAPVASPVWVALPVGTACVPNTPVGSATTIRVPVPLSAWTLAFPSTGKRLDGIDVLIPMLPFGVMRKRSRPDVTNRWVLYQRRLKNLIVWEFKFMEGRL
jgi:hypothetical protein